MYTCRYETCRVPGICNARRSFNSLDRYSSMFVVAGGGCLLFLFVLYRHATKFVVCCTTLPEIHADFFGRNASPLQVYVFVAVANRGEDVMSDEICRRFNRTHQQRTRSGRSVQVSDWFMIRHSSSGHVCTYTYVPRTTKYIRRR